MKTFDVMSNIRVEPLGLVIMVYYSYRDKLVNCILYQCTDERPDKLDIIRLETRIEV